MISSIQEDLLRELVLHIWRVIAGRRLHTHDLRPVASSLANVFSGHCGLAQCIAGYTLQDIGASPHPVATQSLDDYWYGHAALSVEVIDRGTLKWFLVDPTFVQFCGNFQIGDVPTPGFKLGQNLESKSILKELLKNGYFEISPTRAAFYLASFCRSSDSLANVDAFSFLTNPSPHPYHFSFGLNDDRFSRSNLEKGGLLLPASNFLKK